MAAPRATRLLLLVALLAVPTAEADVEADQPTTCLVVESYADATGGAPPVMHPASECSESSTIHFALEVAEKEADALIRFVMTYVSVRAEHGGPARVSPVVADDLDEMRVSVHLHATWRDGCADLTGTYLATVAGHDHANDSLSLGAACLQGAETDATRAILDALVRELSVDAPPLGASLDDLLRRLPPPPAADAPEADLGAARRRDPPPERRADEFEVDLRQEAGTDGDDALDATTRADASALHHDASVASAARAPPGRPLATLFPVEEPVRAPPAEAVSAFAAPPSPVPLAPRPPLTPADEPARDPPASPGPAAQPALATESVVVRPPPPEPARAVAQVAVAAGAGAALLLLAAIALYQRITRPKALDHPSRRALHAACVASGDALTVAELAAATGLTDKAAVHHLRYLAKLGLLREERAPGEPTRFVIPEAPKPEAPEPLDSRVATLLQERPGLTAAELARALEVPYGRVDHLLKGWLLDARVESRVESGRRAYFLSSTSSGRAPDSDTGTDKTSP